MPTWNTQREAASFIDNVFMRTARIVAGEHFVYDEQNNYRRALPGRTWFTQQWNRHRIHDAVIEMMRNYRPTDWQQLLLEWPHKSLTDPNRLAYTRDERSAMHDGDSDIKAVITTIGKYLTRHFPDAPSNVIRDIVAQYTYGGTVIITNDPDEMVRAVTTGPRSCMSGSFDLRCADGETRHPYAVYDPDLGWGMAVRYDGSDVMGRCLVLDNEDFGRGFVRSYKRERDQYSHSGTDEAIEAHLRSIGYERWSGWPDGALIAKYQLRGDGWLMPYIDGGSQHVTPNPHDDEQFKISRYGDWEACSTGGYINGYNCTCEDCGDGFDEDNEGAWVGRHEDRHVCGSCLDNEYTYAIGYRGRHYYIRNDDVVNVNGDYYDVNYLSENEIVQLHDGEYAFRDDAVYIESEDAYYDCDDDDICYAENTNQYELTDNCWQCAESGNWYTDDEDFVEVDGDKYHPDNAPDVEDDDEEEDEVELIAVTDATITETN